MTLRLAVATQMPLCYHPTIEYELVGWEKQLGASESTKPALFPGIVSGKPRREEILRELKAGGLLVEVGVKRCRHTIPHRVHYSSLSLLMRSMLSTPSYRRRARTKARRICLQPSTVSKTCWTPRVAWRSSTSTRTETAARLSWRCVVGAGCQSV
jgi:hypothetical protein